MQVISDHKLQVADANLSFGHYFLPDVVSTSDYYPYGMEVAARSFSVGGYRYGFQGQETDDEFLGGAVSYKYRVHDARIGRFLSRDPLAPEYPQWTPYSFSGNLVINAKELEGAEYVLVIYSPDVSNKFKALDAGDVYSQRALTYWARSHHFTHDFAAKNLGYQGDWKSLPAAQLYDLGDAAPQGVSVITSTKDSKGNIIFDDYSSLELGAFRHYPKEPYIEDIGYPTDVKLGNWWGYELVDYVGVETGVSGGMGPGGGISGSGGYLKGMGFISTSTSYIGSTIGASLSVTLGMMAFSGETIPTVENFEGEGFSFGLSWTILSGSYLRSADGKWQGGSGGLSVGPGLLAVTPSLMRTNTTLEYPIRSNLRYQLKEREWNVNLIPNDPSVKKVPSLNLNRKKDDG